MTSKIAKKKESSHLPQSVAGIEVVVVHVVVVVVVVAGVADDRIGVMSLWIMNEL